MSKKLRLNLLGYCLILLVIVIVIVLTTASYMSLNNWDIRCLFVECKPVRVVGGEE